MRANNYQLHLLSLLIFAKNSHAYSSIFEVFPLLNGLLESATLSPSLGGQNFTQCCLKAFNESLTLVSGNVTRNGINDFLAKDGNPVNMDNLLRGQFPCGAVYQGNRDGVNPVTVPWNWCHQNCPGWEVSSSSKLSQWIQPFVGFILPSVIFCLSVPRRRKLRVPHWVFPRKIDNFRVLWAIYCAMVAALIVSIDTIIWLGTVFAFSGPLLFSGLYEALLDQRIGAFVNEKIRNTRLPLALRARILLAVLVGNLDLESAWKPAMELARSLDRLNLPTVNPNPSINLIASVDRPGVHLLAQHLSAATTEAPSPVNTSNNSLLGSTDDNEVNRVRPVGAPPSDANIELHPLKDLRASREERRSLSILKVKTRLKSMLACQYSFGSTVGAPVIFYIGSFIFTIIEINASLGDNDTANALAFGMWWMSIPHISIVSGCLLAGNNPNTLEAIAPNAGQPSQSLPAGTVGQLDSFSWSFHGIEKFILEPTYEAQYKPATMWERGRSKREWVMKVIDEYSKVFPNDMEAFANRIQMKWGDWVMLSTLAFLLFFIPCSFGFLVAFYTPKVGLACRSLTFLVYASSQTLLLFLWIWNITWRDLDWRRRMRNNRGRRKSVTHTREGEEATSPQEVEAQEDNNPSSVFRKFMSAQWIRRGADRLNIGTRPAGTYLSYLGCSIFRMLMWIGVGSAVFTAIGGTLFQILGLYRNCLCKISVNHWLDKNDNLLLSSNNPADIQAAIRWWRTTGGVATGFLGIVCYIGWWYQRRLRFRFRMLVDRLDDNLPAW